MSQGTFTLEIYPENYYKSEDTSSSFNLVIDYTQNTAPTIASAATGGSSVEWSNAAQAWYQPANSYAYYPYYYNNGYVTDYNVVSASAASPLSVPYSPVPGTPPPPTQAS